MRKKAGKKEYSIKDILDSIDTFAGITKKGFDRMDEFIEEMSDFKNEAGMTLFNIDSKLRTVDERLDAIEKILGPLMKTTFVMGNEIRNLNVRVGRLEHKAGIK